MDVLGLVLDQARVGSDRPAVKDAKRELSYGALEAEVADVAAGLVAAGVTPGERVALLLGNSVDFLVATLACMWTGAIFVPLATTDPDSRIATIVANCEPIVVLIPDQVDVPEVAERVPAHAPIRAMSEMRAATSGVTPQLEEADRAYAIYTSGTTGTPKGVLIGASAFRSAVVSTVQLLHLGVDTRTLCVSPFHFDGSFGTLFPTLAAGGSVVIPPRESLLFPQTFFRAIINEQITYTGFSPSYLRLLLASPAVSKLASSSLAVVALGGEACSASDVEALWAVMPGLKVFNRYGPTETTIAVTHFELDRSSLAHGGAVPIGRPHPDVTFYLVDTTGTLVDSSGAVGELYIGGAQLMEGYWGDPELTDEVIRSDIVAGQRLYRTGDLVYRDEHGNYIYVDRADKVIKRQGVRISLVEVAEALRNLAGISAATCAAYDNAGHPGIAAFVVATTPLGPLDIRKAASASLPSTMLPDIIEVVDSLPLTSSGKVDDRSLLRAAGLEHS